MQNITLAALVECGEKQYQVQLEKGKLGAILSVWQPINGEYHRCGGWYLETLIQDMDIPDSIYIDFGQNWEINAGMFAAIEEACKFLAGEWSTDEY